MMNLSHSLLRRSFVRRSLRFQQLLRNCYPSNFNAPKLSASKLFPRIILQFKRVQVKLTSIELTTWPERACLKYFKLRLVSFI